MEGWGSSSSSGSGSGSGSSNNVLELGGDAAARAELSRRVEGVREALAAAMAATRPTLAEGSPRLGHEAAYSVYRPGASLKRRTLIKLLVSFVRSFVRSFVFNLLPVVR